MSHCCFVPKCKSGRATTGEKVTVFTTPYKRDKPTFEKWIDIMKEIRSDRVLTPEDKICSKHFDETEIVKGIDIVLKDGTKSFFPKPWKLKKGACPTIFNNTKLKNDESKQPEMPTNAQEPQLPPIRSYSRKIKKEKRTTIVPAICQESDKFQLNSTELSSQTIGLPKSINPQEWMDITDEPLEATENEHSSFCPTNAKLPSRFWSLIHIADEDNISDHSIQYIQMKMVAKDCASIVFKQVVIKVGETKAQYFLYGRPIISSHLNTALKSTFHLSSMLSTFDRAALCPGIFEKELKSIDSCPSGFRGTDGSWYSVNCCGVIAAHHKRCSPCSALRKVLSDKLKRYIKKVSLMEPETRLIIKDEPFDL